MSVKMPEPVAWMTKDGRAATKETKDSAMATPSRLAFSVALITTDQAEAYKDACVREALEEAAQACEARIRIGDPGVDTTDVDLEAIACAAAVRNLIFGDEYQSDIQAAAGGLTQKPLEY